jgi:cytochrome c
MKAYPLLAVAMLAKSGLGPNLYGVIGRPVAAVKGFAYSPAMTKKGGKWTPARFESYIAAPAKFVPGNRMTYPGMANPADRQHLIAYLISIAK